MQVGRQEPHALVIRAEVYRDKWTTFSRPVAVACDDGENYVIKGLQAPGNQFTAAALVTEHAAARLGALLACPIPEVRLVQLDAALIVLEPELQHFLPGLTHGVKLVPSCVDDKTISAPTTAQGRDAYAGLAVLYGWFLASDHQVVISTINQDVHSVDHGLFLQGGPNWTSASLAGAPPPLIDPRFGAHVQQAEIDVYLQKLSAVTDQAIARVLGSVPPGWGVPDDALAALGSYLSDRRARLLNP